MRGNIKNDKKRKDENEFCGYKKENVQQAVLVAGKTKERKNEKKRGKKGKNNVTKSKKAKNFGRVPQQIISSSAFTV